MSDQSPDTTDPFARRRVDRTRVCAFCESFYALLNDNLCGHCRDAVDRREFAAELAPCVECGRPVAWDDAAGDYRHMAGPACALALEASP